MYVQGNGSAILKAIQVFVTLYKKSEGIAVVLVDIEEDKVLEYFSTKL